MSITAGPPGFTAATASNAEQPTPTPRGEGCPLCGAPLDPEQEWCLHCGAAARTRLAASPNWRAPMIAVVIVAVLSLGVLAAALVKLAGDSGSSAPTTSTVTAAPTASAPPATTTTPLTPTQSTPVPGATQPGTVTQQTTPPTTSTPSVPLNKALVPGSKRLNGVSPAVERALRKALLKSKQRK